MALCACGDASGAGGADASPSRLGLGREVAPHEVAKFDRDVGPDGAELPPGQGTVAEGATIYAAKCASCHGAKGEGMTGGFPAVIGRPANAEGFPFGGSSEPLDRTIGNYWPYATTVFDYVRRAMPQLTPGTLSDAEVYSLTAYLLAANQVIPMDATLDAASLRAVKMPYQDRFVPDNRKGGREVK
ncbi:MAG: cytochrome c [Gemmatimonadetes bacterium]|nr:cytochrome c [Gemmatimonadota bacterium]